MEVHKLNPPLGRPSTAAEAVDYIIAAAIKLKASDIHISINIPTTANPDDYLLRFRVFGKLQIIKSGFLDQIYREVIARIKILAEMNTTDYTVPSDGQMTIDTPEGLVVLRISTVPSVSNEEMVIRIQKNNDENLSIDLLAMTNAMKNRLKKLVSQKSGLILLNGPAGSGKTTTIYSIINSIASPEKKIITAEDPVETRLPYVNHGQVSGKTTFASLSRAFMRQDADVIFIGEIRDEESAHTALQLAQTGHLVLSTLHSRDAVGAISRLEALGQHPTNIATTLIGSMSQRLVPALCEACRVPQTLDEATIKRLGEILKIGSKTKFYQAGPGCTECVGGYSGRIPLFELFVVDDELADAITQRKTKTEIVRLARSKGMALLAEEALLRVYAGYTDLESVKAYIETPDYS
jgi:type II secretory ATPase GspE/PulE/Tfp pilus assembly ATPase PilB-like protein